MPIRILFISLALLCGCFAPGAFAQTRLPTIAPENYDAEQKAAAAEFLEARKAPVFGPFEPLMYSPEVMTRARSMGDYLRYHSAIGNKLSELVILVTAREWTEDFEWSIHAPIALKMGIGKDTVDAIADGRRPEAMPEDEQVVYDFAEELLRHKRVSDVTYARAEKRLGRKGVVDLTAISGYYSMLAMELRVARYPLPADAKPLPRLPE
ncbi:MAG: carboxymuconolactone decarboxylase family protein [Burkholderiaceae bacterium]|jgi:4-carboxymuconolactone decarboxylase